MNIVTLHEAEQNAEVCKPLWTIYSTFANCSGPCGQGRSLCMTPEACQTGDHQADGEVVTRADDLWFWGGLAAALAVFVVCAAVMARWLL